MQRLRRMWEAQVLLLVRGRIGDERAPMPVARHHEARCHVLAEERDALGAFAVTYGQGAAGIIVVYGIRQCTQE
jgi:hypothetical protein